MISLSGQAGAASLNDTLNGAWLIEYRQHYGFVLRHHSDMFLYTQKHFPAFELSLMHQTTGAQPWHVRYNYPQTGITLFYSPLSSPRYLGTITGLYPFVNFPLLRTPQQQLAFRLGAGMSYLSKHFDRISNYKNLAIGSPVNVLISLGMQYSWKFNEQWMLSGGLSLTHTSNGTYTTPNAGLNVASCNMAMAYTLPYHRHGKMRLTTIRDQRYHLLLSLSGGGKEIQPVGGVKYGVGALVAECLVQPDLKRRWGGGLDCFYDGSDKALMRAGGQWNNHNESLVKGGAHVTYVWLIDRASIYIQAGVYIWQKEKSDGMIWDRVGIRYRMKNGLFADFSLKSHFARADVILFGLGKQISW